MEKNDKLKTGTECEASFKALCENLEKLSIEAQEYSDVEFERFKKSKCGSNERLDFIEDIWDIAENLKSLNSRVKKIFKRGKEKGIF